MAAINSHTNQYYLTHKAKIATTIRPMLQMDVNSRRLSLFQTRASVTTLILGNVFDGAREIYNGDWHLQSRAGRAPWFPEFTPLNYIALRFIYELLKHFFGVTYVVT